MDFERHLVWVMRSIASAWRRKAAQTAKAGASEVRETTLRAKQLRLFGEDGEDAAAAPIPDVASREPDADAERRWIAKEQVDAIVRHFADDPEAKEVIWVRG